jgi:hypothetical protein
MASQSVSFFFLEEEYREAPGASPLHSPRKKKVKRDHAMEAKAELRGDQQV